MACTHPVLYSRNGGLYCHICGMAINTAEAEKPVETAKKAATSASKRKGKAKA